MLVLSRKQDEEILIGDNVCIKVVGVFGNKVRLGISAPAQVAIRRGELSFFGKMNDQIQTGDHLESVEFDIPTLGNCLLQHPR